MNLSPDEARALKLLQEQRRRWTVQRWFRLAYGVGTLIVGLYLSVEFKAFVESNATAPSEVAIPLVSNFTVLRTLALIFIFVGALTVLWTLGRWKGNPTQLLMLRLFEDRTDG